MSETYGMPIGFVALGAVRTDGAVVRRDVDAGVTHQIDRERATRRTSDGGYEPMTARHDHEPETRLDAVRRSNADWYASAHERFAVRVDASDHADARVTGVRGDEDRDEDDPGLGFAVSVER